MRIYTLLENDTISKKYKAAHGLSLYIETSKHKILFDLGPNNYYIKNAKSMGIDLTEVDIVILSHGHNDHGTGIQKFLAHNHKAVIYASKNIFDEHVKQKNSDHINIGIKPPKMMDRIRLLSKNTIIDEEVQLVLDVPYVETAIQDNALFEYRNGQYVRDSFEHELYLVLHQGLNHVLISGCSHKGLDHIIETIEKVNGFALTHIIGGYHFSHYDPFDFKETDYLTHLSQKFAKRTDSQFYSCHCTGDDAFFQLKIHMKNQLKRIKTGEIINI